MVCDFIVFGALGLQGRIVSRDLLEKGYSLLLVDKETPLDQGILSSFPKTASFVQMDVRDDYLVQQVIRDSGSKIVVNCVEGDWNLQLLDSCIATGVHSIDLGSEIWMTKLQFDRNSLLREKNCFILLGWVPFLELATSCCSTPAKNLIQLTLLK